MKKNILDFINKSEGWKTAIKNIHWDSNNLSQHKLCDDIADRLSDFQDSVAEVEQSISGNLPLNKLQPKQYKISTLKNLIKDIINDTTSFYKGLNGDDYIGMRSECETFIQDFQKFNYLVNFTIKEDFKRKLKKKLNENKVKLTEKEFRESLSLSINKALNEENLDSLIQNRSHEKYVLNNGLAVEIDLEDPTITIWKNNEIQREYNGQNALNRIEYLINLWNKEGNNNPFESVLEKVFNK